MSFKILRIIFPLVMFAAATLITTAVIKQPVKTNSKAFEKKASPTPTVKPVLKPSPTPLATPSASTPTWETLTDKNGDGVVNVLDYSF